MLENYDKFADIKIKNNDKIYKLHKIVLYQIPWFSKILNGNFEESTFDIIETNFDANIWDEVIQFLYKKPAIVSIPGIVSIILHIDASKLLQKLSNPKNSQNNFFSYSYKKLSFIFSIQHIVFSFSISLDILLSFLYRN